MVMKVPLLVVTALMVFHVALGGELFAAHRALEGLFICVDTRVNYKVRPLRESLLASWVLAPIGLGPHVKIEVSLESTLPGEALFAVLVHAYKPIEVFEIGSRLWKT
jgi:hypothetical protein